MRVTTLLSGGLDSAVLLAALLEAEHQVEALYVLPVSDSGGPMAERQAASAIARHFDVPIVYAEVSAGDAFVPPSLGGQAVLVPLAAAIAWDRAREGLAWAAHGGQAAPAVALAQVLRVALRVTAPRLEVVLPFLEHPKPGLVAIGATLGVPFDRTYSCELGEPTHCGACLSCGERRAAFVAADVPDPTSYAVEPEALEGEDDDAGEESAQETP